MEKTNKFKLFLGLIYLILICLFLYFFFSKFSLQEITSYDFIRENRSYFVELKNSNLPDEIRIGAVLREKKVIIPRSDFVFQKDDQIVFLVKKDFISVVENIFRLSSV